jgi:hypothetical protein
MRAIENTFARPGEPDAPLQPFFGILASAPQRFANDALYTPGAFRTRGFGGQEIAGDVAVATIRVAGSLGDQALKMEAGSIEERRCR